MNLVINTIAKNFMSYLLLFSRAQKSPAVVDDRAVQRHGYTLSVQLRSLCVVIITTSAAYTHFRREDKAILPGL